MRDKFAAQMTPGTLRNLCGFLPTFILFTVVLPLFCSFLALFVGALEQYVRQVGGFS